MQRAFFVNRAVIIHIPTGRTSQSDKNWIWREQKSPKHLGWKPPLNGSSQVTCNSHLSSLAVTDSTPSHGSLLHWPKCCTVVNPFPILNSLEQSTPCCSLTTVFPPNPLQQHMKISCPVHSSPCRYICASKALTKVLSRPNVPTFLLLNTPSAWLLGFPSSWRVLWPEVVPWFFDFVDWREFSIFAPSLVRNSIYEAWS